MTDDRSKNYLHYVSYKLGRAWPDDLDFTCQVTNCSCGHEVGTGSAFDMVTLIRKNHAPLVLTSGSFDLFNIGHEQYLHLAASYGGALIVGVDSDEKVRRRKGPDRPICCQHARMESVSRHPAVSLVLLKHASAVRWSLIQAIRPDVLIVSRPTYSESELTSLGSYARSIVVVERTGQLSTSWLIQCSYSA